MSDTLIVLSVHSGFDASTLVNTWFTLVEQGRSVIVATPKGQIANPDAGSFSLDRIGSDLARRLNLQEQLEHLDGLDSPKSLERLSLVSINLDSIIVIGSPDTLPQDLMESAALGNLLKRMNAQNGLIGAIGNGMAGLLPARHEENWLFAGYRMARPDNADLCQTLQDNGAGLAALTEPLVADLPLYTASDEGAVRLAAEFARTLKRRASLDKNQCGTSSCG